MAKSLNSLFRPASETVVVKIGEQVDKNSESRQAPEKARQRFRAERVDKKKDIKFPVTPTQRETLRRLAKDMRKENRDPSRKYETISNTEVLKKALEQHCVFPERYPPLLYEDTGQYMHAEPLLRDHEQIEDLAIKWNLSIRKTVYRLIMNYIHRGEVDSVAYRAGQ